ncbi:MAG: peptidylprolyl isomerase [bacterium]
MKKTAIIFISLIIILSGIFAIGYFFNKDIFSKISFKNLEYPAFKVNGQSRSLADLDNNTQANIKFYSSENIFDFNSEDGEKLKKIVEKKVLQIMIETALMEKIAADKGIQILDSEIQSNLDEVIAKVGDKENFQTNLSKAFGWTVEDFKNNIVRKQVVEEKLKEYISSSEDLNQEALKKVEEILEMVKSGKDFGELAKEHSECPSAAQNGDLGNFSRMKDDPNFKYPHMVSSFEEAAFALNPGETSEIVKTQYGYHIIKLENKTKDDEGIETANAKHILIKTADFDKWFDDQLKSAEVSIYLNDYVWDKESGQIKFKDDEMNKFEMEKNAQLEG